MNLKEILARHGERIEGWEACGGVGQTQADAVFCNRELRMGGLEAIGFDYDFTLAEYGAPRGEGGLGAKIFELAKRYLVDHIGYPKVVGALEYREDHAIRGLAYDKAQGLFVKLDGFNYIDDSCVYSGHRRLSRDEVAGVYSSSGHMPKAYMEANVVLMHDLFCLPEISLLSAIIDIFNAQGFNFDPGHVHADARIAIDAVHSGIAGPGIHKAIMENPEEYLGKNPELPGFLDSIRDAGKRSFLLTNSPFAFVDVGMTYLLDDPAWVSRFDAVVCSAAKPSFFKSNQPFRELRNPHSPSPELSWSPVETFAPGSVYVQGNVDDFHRLLGVDNPHRLLYIGDNLPADLVSPARRHSWRTAAIIRELEDEVRVANSPTAIVRAGILAQTKETISQVTDLMFTLSGPDLAAAEAALDELRAFHRLTEDAIAALYNPRFGSTLRARDHVSRFASTVEVYADVYTSSVTNFIDYGMSYEFFPKVRLAQHESEPDYTICRPASVDWSPKKTLKKERA